MLTVDARRHTRDDHSRHERPCRTRSSPQRSHGRQRLPTSPASATSSPPRRCRRAAGRPEFAAARALRPLCRAALGHGVHRAARRQSPLLAVPHPAGGDARAVPRDRQRPHREPRSATCRRRPTSCAGTRCRCPTRRPISSTASSRWPATAIRRAMSGCAHPPLRREPLDGRPLLLQRRRRDADRAAAGTAALRDRARAASTSSRRRSR